MKKKNEIKNQTLSIFVIMTCKFVRSKYSVPWLGVVIDKKHRTREADLYLILILLDKNGNVPSKRIVKTCDARWTEEIEKFDITYINKDWLAGLPIL